MRFNEIVNLLKPYDRNSSICDRSERKTKLRTARIGLVVLFSAVVLVVAVTQLARTQSARSEQSGSLKPQVVGNESRPFTESWAEMVNRGRTQAGAPPSSKSSDWESAAGDEQGAEPFTISTSFKAIGMEQQVNDLAQSAWPPGTFGAIGPNHFIEMVNQSVAIYAKSGTRLSHVRLRDFLTITVGANTYNASFDPRVVYDKRSGRFFASCTGSAPAASEGVILAVSRTNDPTGIWDKYLLEVGESSAFLGSATLGLDDNGVYLGITVIPQVGTSSSKIVATSKASLLAPTPTLSSVFQFSNVADSVSSPQPAFNFDAAGPTDPEFFVYSSSSSRDRINYRSLTWSGSTPTLSGATSVTTPNYALPVSAPASGGAVLNLSDDRLLSAAVRGGKLWTVRHVGLNATGAATAPDRTGCEWFQLGISSTSLSVLQTGRVFDAAVNPIFYYFPSITVNSRGDAVMGFSGSNTNQFISAYFAGRLNGDASGTMGAVQLVKSGVASYERTVGNGVNPWGRVSATLVDPNDDVTFWTLQAYAEAHTNNLPNNVNSNWGTWLAEILPAAPTPNTTPGNNVRVETSDASVTFSTVSQSGTTTFTPINPASAGTPPSGYTLCPTCSAYDITTTATVVPPITVCLGVPSGIDQPTFLALALLHGENGTLIDRTTAHNTMSGGTREVCGVVQSLSPFVLAQVAATPSPTPTPSPSPTPATCSSNISYSVNAVVTSVGGDTFEFPGIQNSSIALTSGVGVNQIFENGLLLRPNNGAITPSGEFSANVSFTITFDNSVSTTLSRVVRYKVTPTLRLISFETGDAKTVDLGVKGKVDVTVAPRALGSSSNAAVALQTFNGNASEVSFRLHDIPGAACTAPGTLQFSATSYDASEGSATQASNAVGSGELSPGDGAFVESPGTALLLVTRNGDLSQPASVEYATQSGSALDRTDFTAAYGTLRFAAGESSKSLVILITDDVYSESTESFFVTLSDPVGVALGTLATTTVQIVSDDSSTGVSPVANAAFDSDKFVRYQYADFLNRLPDSPGLAFWKGQIDQCEQRPVAERQGCREATRVNVSAAFFQSIEFQETGYLVYRLHQSAFNSGEHLLLSRFLKDTQEIRQGIVVGQGNWEQQLEANKQLFALRFVTRPEFLTLYPTSMTAAQFVDALNTNTGGSLSQTERDTIVNQLATAGNTSAARATALRSVVDDADFRSREMNRAFVLMQYFGYLRRNPPDAPDLTQDYQGYNFWLGKLNQFNGNFVSAEMVRAFIEATEYRTRFGQ